MMMSLTDSKIIHEANEDEEFEENPRYYHRNVQTQQQINQELSRIGNSVNVFVNSFRTNVKNQEMSPSKHQKQKNKDIGSSTNFSEIMLQTQAFINSINSISDTQKINEGKIKQKQNKFSEEVESSKKSKYRINKHNILSRASKKMTLGEKDDFKFIHNRSVPVRQGYGIPQNKHKQKSLMLMSKTDQIYIKDPDRQNKSTLHPKKYAKCIQKTECSIGFQQFLENDDDKETVVNEERPKRKSHRRLYLHQDGNKKIQHVGKKKKQTKEAEILSKLQKIQTQLSEFRALQSGASLQNKVELIPQKKLQPKQRMLSRCKDNRKICLKKWTESIWEN